jgi:hypothetical protein
VLPASLPELLLEGLPELLPELLELLLPLDEPDSLSPLSIVASPPLPPELVSAAASGPPSPAAGIPSFWEPHAAAVDSPTHKKAIPR